VRGGKRRDGGARGRTRQYRRKNLNSEAPLIPATIQNERKGKTPRVSDGRGGRWKRGVQENLRRLGKGTILSHERDLSPSCRT